MQHLDEGNGNRPWGHPDNLFTGLVSCQNTGRPQGELRQWGQRSPTGRLTFVEIFGIEITRRRYGNGFQDLADVAPMIRSMRNDVEEDFLARQRTGVPIGEAEFNGLTQLITWESGCIIHVPSIRFSHIALQL